MCEELSLCQLGPLVARNTNKNHNEHTHRTYSHKHRLPPYGADSAHTHAFRSCGIITAVNPHTSAARTNPATHRLIEIGSDSIGEKTARSWCNTPQHTFISTAKRGERGHSQEGASQKVCLKMCCWTAEGLSDGFYRARQQTKASVCAQRMFVPA